MEAVPAVLERPDVQEQLHLIADKLPVCLAYVDAGERYRFVNATYEEWHNTRLEEIRGRRVRSILGEKSYAAVRPHIEAALRGLLQSFDYYAEYQSGQARQVHVEYVPDPTPDGRIMGFFAIISDITDRKEQALQITELVEQLGALAATAFDGVAMIQAGSIVSANERLAESLGVEKDALVGRPVADVLGIEANDWTEAIAAGSSRRGIVQRKDGGRFPVEVCGVDVKHRGQPARLLAVRDLTETMGLQREVIETGEREQARIGRELHDGLGQMLTGLALGLKGLRNEIDPGKDDLRERLDTLTSLAQRAIEEARQLGQGLSPILDPAGGLRRALRQLTNDVARLTGVECRLEWQGPALDDDSAAANHLYRIAQEAINNAIRHGWPATVEVSCTVKDYAFRMSIFDDGGGIDLARSARAGMGIRTMTYRAALIDGTLTVERVGDGTMVTCDVPRLS